MEKKMRQIGHRLQEEQNLTSDDIDWLIVIAQAILRAFVWEESQPMRTLADTLEVSPTTLYLRLRLAVVALQWVDHHKQSIETLLHHVQTLQEQLNCVQQAYQASQVEVERLSKALAQAHHQLQLVRGEVAHLHQQWVLMKERLIVVLKMSGRCSVRSIVEVLDCGLGISVSVGYVQGVLHQAGENAPTLLERLRPVLPLSGAICIDEVYLKEMSSHIYGVVIVDPLSGLVLGLTRCQHRSKEALGEVIDHFAQAGFKEHIKLCLSDMYSAYIKPVQAHLPQAVHQFCWFHINCFHIGATVRRANRAAQKASAELATFDKKHCGSLTPVEQQQRQALEDTHQQAHRYWQEAQQFQRMLKRVLQSESLESATRHLERLIRVADRLDNPYVQSMGTFLSEHQKGLIEFFTCLESQPHRLQRWSPSQQSWVEVSQRGQVPITTNAAEHVFRCLRRYTHQMTHFATPEGTQRFFDLFVFYHNLRTLRAGKEAGNSLLAAAQVDVKKLFGSDDPYTILGFPPASQAFIQVKSVQASAA